MILFSGQKNVFKYRTPNNEYRPEGIPMGNVEVASIDVQYFPLGSLRGDIYQTSIFDIRYSVFDIQRFRYLIEKSEQPQGNFICISNLYIVCGDNGI